MPMLAYHTIDDWTTRSSSAEACRSTPAHPCRALGLTPERCEAEVLLAVCIAVVVGGHGRVATAHQIAPWSRGSDLLSPTAVGAAFPEHFCWRFVALPERHGHRTATQINRHTPRYVGSVPIDRLVMVMARSRWKCDKPSRGARWESQQFY